MAAYNAGRELQVRDNPLVAALVYDAIVDGVTTELCQKLDGTILPKSDRRWKQIAPTNHHGCRSVLTPLSAEQMQRRGLRLSDLDLGAIRADPVLSREWQFRASPATTLDEVPPALAKRATDYGKWADILRFSARALRGHIGRRLRAVREADYVPDAVREHLGHQVWLGTVPQPGGGMRAMVHLVRVEGSRISVVRIGLQRGAGSAYTLAAREWAKLRRTWQRIE